jgi:hypothetical protein
MSRVQLNILNIEKVFMMSLGILTLYENRCLTLTSFI